MGVESSKQFTGSSALSGTNKMLLRIEEGTQEEQLDMDARMLTSVNTCFTHANASLLNTLLFNTQRD